MKKNKFLIFFISGLFLFSLNNAYGQQVKLAQTGMKFLSVSTDARASAMGEALTSIHGSASAMFYNPAGMANLDRMADFTFGHTSWIADINYLHAGAAFQPFQDDYYGVIGISVIAVDYGDFRGTIKANNEQGYLDVGTFSPKAFAFGIGYARSLSEKFAIGGNIKYVSQSLGTAIIGFTNSGDINEGKYNADVMAFDFGIIYKTGYKSFNIGMSIRNFSREVGYIEENFELPLTFRLGASVNAFDFFEQIDRGMHSLLISVDAAHPRDFAEQLFLGGEYTFMDMFSLRFGYSFPQDERGTSAGVGINQEIAGVRMGVDYAYAPFGLFDNVHRFSVNIGY